MVFQNSGTVNVSFSGTGTHVDIVGCKKNNSPKLIPFSPRRCATDIRSQQAKLGWAWIALALATALHVLDESLTGFLPVYNLTVIAGRQRWGWYPMPTFTFGVWLGGLIGLVIVLFLLSPFAFRNARWLRPIAYFLSVVMILNAAGHTFATILGRTFASVRLSRPAPGFYSSPLLAIGAVYLLLQLRRTAVNTDKRTATTACLWM